MALLRCAQCDWVQPSGKHPRCFGCSATPFHGITESQNGSPLTEDDLIYQGMFYVSMKSVGMDEEKIMDIIEEKVLDMLL